MALPAIVASMAGGVVAGLVQFFVSKAGMILAGMGLTFIGVKGLQTFLGYAITDINLIASQLNSSGGGGSGLGPIMLQFAAYAGLFDGVNILISGYMAYASLLGVRFVLGRVGGLPS